jgi:hypothetical protein
MVFTKEQILQCFPVLEVLISVHSQTFAKSYAETLERRFDPAFLLHTGHWSDSEVENLWKTYEMLTKSDVFARMCKQNQISDELTESIRMMGHNDLDEIKAKATDLEKYTERSRNRHMKQQLRPWLQSLLVSIAAEERDRQEKRLAFAMGGHPRLGGISSMKDLTDDLLEKIAQPPTSAHVTCARCSKYILD